MKAVSLFRKVLALVWSHLHYAGLVLIVALMVQAHLATQKSERTLATSVKRQESLRNILWVNLLTQRSVVLSFGSILRSEPGERQNALRMIKSAQEFLPEDDLELSEQSRLFKGQLKEIEKLTASSSTKREHLDLLFKKAEDFGVTLNNHESLDWFNLLEQNEVLLKELGARKRYLMLTYALFVGYLIFLGFIMARRKLAERRLIQSEKRQRQFAEASFEGLAILKDGDKIYEVNPAFEALFAVSSAEIMGRSIKDFLVPTDEQGGPVLDLKNSRSQEAQAKIAGGAMIPVEVASRESMVDREPIRIVAVKDISHKKQTENLKLEKEAAERANHAKSVFLANMSHELRTPMHGVLSFARFGMTETAKAQQMAAHSYFEEIFESGSHLMQLLNDLLDLAKLEAGKMTYSMAQNDLGLLCDRALSELSALAQEKRLTLDFKRLTGEEYLLVMDSERIAQVIRNVLSNAIKFSDPDSTVEVTLAIEKTAEQDELVCRVGNHGHGIPKSELETVFDKFVQSSKTRTGAGGTGLGLSICKEIVESHQGRIWAESDESGWTVFSFRLPVQPKMMEQTEMKATG